MLSVKSQKIKCLRSEKQLTGLRNLLTSARRTENNERNLVIRSLLMFGLSLGLLLLRADASLITAVQGQGDYSVGYVNKSGVGFSFVPNANLVVSKVSYASYTDAIISFWINGAPFLAFYSFDLGTADAGGFRSLPFAVNLTASSQYSIIVQDGDLPNAGTTVFEASAVANPASQITQYSATVLNTDGTVSPFPSVTSAFYFGVNFQYNIAPVPEAKTLLPLLFFLTCITVSEGTKKLNGSRKRFCHRDADI